MSTFSKIIYFYTVKYEVLITLSPIYLIWIRNLAYLFPLIIYLNPFHYQQSCSLSFQQIGGKYYHIEHYDKLNWDNARDKCRSMNAHLVSIQDFEEWSAINNHLKRCKSYWVDIIDKDYNYNFISDTTGWEAPFLNWSAGQPRHRNGYDCVKLRSGSHHMKTKYCSQRNHYICEKKTSPATSAQIGHPATGYDIIDLDNRN